jgi:hypothetical protein
MMPRKSTLILISSLFAAAAWAGGHGDSAGNGGTVMACQPNTAQETLITYDIYEGQVQRHLTPDMGATGMDYLQKVELVINRIPEQNAEFRQTLLNYLQEFKTHSEFGDFDLVPVDDTGQLVLAPGCIIRQAAVQREPFSSVEKRYFLDQKIWNRLDENSKAALVLHEIVYRMTIVAGHNTSVGARLLNSILMDGHGILRQPCLYLSVLNDLQTAQDQFAKIGDLTVLVPNSSISPACQLKNAVVVDGTITVHGQKIRPANEKETSLFYSDDGRVEQIVINQPQILNIGGVSYRLGLDEKGLGQILFDEQENVIQATVDHIDITVQGHHIVLAKGILYFAADGSVSGVSALPSGFALSIDSLQFQKVMRADLFQNQLRVWAPQDITLKTPQGNVLLAGLFFFSEKNQLMNAMLKEDTQLQIGKQSCVAAGTVIHFYPSHSVREFVANQNCQLQTEDGELRSINAGSLVSLNEQGQVVDTH